MSIPFLGDIVDMVRRLLAPADALPHLVSAALTLKNMGGGKYDGVVSATADFALAMRQMGFSAFRARWAFVRQLMTLQGRLFIEQVLWAMGPPWRSLLTGFNPIELGGVGILVPFREAPFPDPNVGQEADDGAIPLPPYVPRGDVWVPPGGEPTAVIQRVRRKRRWKAYYRR